MMFSMNYVSCTECKHFYEDDGNDYCKLCIHNSTERYDPLTVADKIKRMYPSSLAAFLYALLDSYKDQDTPDEGRIAKWLDSCDIDVGSI